MMKRKGKCMLPIRMIPWDEEFLHVSAMVLFSNNYAVAEWMKGTPMPEGLVGHLVREITSKKAEAAFMGREV